MWSVSYATLFTMFIVLKKLHKRAGKADYIAHGGVLCAEDATERDGETSGEQSNCIENSVQWNMRFAVKANILSY